ncbi:thiol-disulfide oxidoreductase DCC family protein [Tellurirhabdus rosea]|uniref:thiol-disulfide oxidoreductase DCC family protein n=1 Tax=Tellurirhabdus rosea TaxID=2674997 RepID=UPI00225C085E|nr:DCC1-like thiol-disulfide oxidoreductase family protein [Tellurirhabdus rosea]
MNAIIVFDGVCGFCNGFVQFVIRRDPAGAFTFVSAGSARGQRLRREAGVAALDSILLVENGVVYQKSEAILRIARRLSGPWRWAWAFSVVPRTVRDALYDRFARHRYLFGRTTSCQLLTAEQRTRIVLTD